jgi:hypothetical protein
MPTTKLEPEQQVLAVVILGNFNPVIFHPTWYAQNGLIPEEEIADATEVITSDEVATFQLNDVHFQAERHRFGLTTKDISRAPFLRDLAVGSFTLLEHTPLTALGLNLDTRFSLPSVDAWHAVGHRLAPKKCWEGILDSPGMLGVSMQGKRPETKADRVSIRVQPADSLENGVFVGVNQHYNIETEQRKSIADRNTEVMRILNEDWNSFRDYAARSAVALVNNNGVTS